VTVGTKGRYGAIANAGLGIACGMGSGQCSSRVRRGTTVFLAARQAPAGLFLGWQGCDAVQGQQCQVTMNGARDVRAIFVYDFVGQAEPPTNGLFSLDRKAEIAEEGAKFAGEGAQACALTAALIGGTIVTAPVVVIGAMTEGQALLAKLLEDSFGDCVEGLGGTIFNGLLLKIDPPDPAWRDLALAEPLPRTAASRCGVRRNCKRVAQARRSLSAANRAVAERQEALAVAANRFGNAVTAQDRQKQALHAISMRVLSGMLADALDARNVQAKRLLQQLRKAGVRSITIPKRAMAKALRAQARGKGIPKAVIARLLRKHLVTSRKAAIADIKQQARGTKPHALDLMAALRRPAVSAAMRRDAASLTIADLVLLTNALQAQSSIAPAGAARQQDLVAEALRCQPSAPSTLQILAAEAGTTLPGDAGRQLAWLARHLARQGVPVSPACSA
jgi:hypothetical protein